MVMSDTVHFFTYYVTMIFSVSHYAQCLIFPTLLVVYILQRTKLRQDLRIASSAKELYARYSTSFANRD